jgi:hypothetical protein
VRATNADGESAWVQLQPGWYAPLGSLTPATCIADEYLATGIFGAFCALAAR